MKQFKVDWNIHPDPQNVALRKTLALVRHLYRKDEVLDCIPEDVYLKEFIKTLLDGDHSGIGLIMVDVSQIDVVNIEKNDFECLIYNTLREIGQEVYGKEVVLA